MITNSAADVSFTNEMCYDDIKPKDRIVAADGF